MATVSCLRTIWTVCLLSYMYVLVKTCSEEFLDMARVCHERVEGGLPRLHTGPLIMVDDFSRMEAYCRLNVTSHVTECMMELYECPAHVEMRTSCDLASLQPEMLVRRLTLTCAVVDVLKEEMDCVNQQTCAVQRCLATVTRKPDSMTLAILNPPNSGNKCNWLDRVKKCYDLHVRPACSDAIADYMATMLDTYKPQSCLNSQTLSLTLHSGSSSQQALLSVHQLVCLMAMLLCVKYL